VSVPVAGRDHERRLTEARVASVDRGAPFEQRRRYRRVGDVRGEHQWRLARPRRSRGVCARVEQPEWDALCRQMEQAFKKGQYAEGALQAIEATTRLLARHFPPRGRNPNELPDKPVVL